MMIISKNTLKKSYQNDNNKFSQSRNHEIINIEIRSGAGGDESSIFANEIFDMYKKYARRKKWEVQKVKYRNDGNHISAITFTLTGSDVYKKMKLEQGVHRVQRIPKTESHGRIHTSTASVAVLPAESENKHKIKEEDIKIEVFRASGAGGQHVNKTSSAVRITHIPTGIIVSCQDERKQFANRKKALLTLQHRLQHLQDKKKRTTTNKIRENQIKRSKRADKFRTYNFPRNQITDQRLNLKIGQLHRIMKKGNLEVIHSSALRQK